MSVSLVQVLLPLEDNRGRRISRTSFVTVKDELTRRFGGVTAYMHAPADGQWVKQGKRIRDQIIIVEVMVGRLERTWWKDYRKALEARFRQRSIVVRMHKVELL